MHHRGDPALAYHLSDHHRSSFLGARLLPRTRSSKIPTGRGRKRKGQNLRRACSASLENFAGDDEEEEEFVKRLQELLAFKVEQEEEAGVESEMHSESRRNQEAESSSATRTTRDYAFSSYHSISSPSLRSSSKPSVESSWLSDRPEPPEWPTNVERKANSVDLPLSLRIIKRKKQQRWEEGSLLREAGESACCSIQLAAEGGGGALSRLN